MSSQTNLGFMERNRILGIARKSKDPHLKSLFQDYNRQVMPIQILDFVLFVVILCIPIVGLIIGLCGIVYMAIKMKNMKPELDAKLLVMKSKERALGLIDAQGKPIKQSKTPKGGQPNYPTYAYGQTSSAGSSIPTQNTYINPCSGACEWICVQCGINNSPSTNECIFCRAPNTNLHKAI
jgi:hypothetical protein